jgi:excisionase family DNA binding protein
MPEILTTQELAARLGVDLRTVQRHLQSGKLKARRLGRNRYVLESDSQNDTAIAAIPSDAVLSPIEQLDRQLDAIEQRIAALERQRLDMIEQRLDRLERRKIIIAVRFVKRT